MSKYRKHILNCAYEAYKNNQPAYIDCPKEQESYRAFCSDFTYLKEKGYIKPFALCNSNYISCKLTATGVDYCENGFQEINPFVINQGDNSTLIYGSNNNVTNNYSNIYKNIQETDMLQEHKELVYQLLQELQTTPKEKAFEKFKVFVTNITDKGLTAAINYSLPLFLAEVFSHIP